MFLEHFSRSFHEAGYNEVQCWNDWITANFRKALNEKMWFKLATSELSLPRQRPPSPVHRFQVCVAQVQLTAHQNDRSSGAEVLYLRIPHGLHVVQRVWVGDGKAQHHHVGPDRRGAVHVLLKSGCARCDAKNLTCAFESHLPYANRRSLWWSPKVSQRRRDTLTSSTTSRERSNTCSRGESQLWLMISFVYTLLVNGWGHRLSSALNSMVVTTRASVFNAAASQQECWGFDFHPENFLCRVCMFSLFLHGFSPGSLASSNKSSESNWEL